jgi:thioredoxin 1
MNESKKDDDCGSACQCRGGSCRSGPGKWIWIVLAVAILGVLIAKSAGKKGTAASVPEAAGGTLAAVAPTQPVAQGKTLPLLLDLGATKCIPCTMMAPILEDLQKTHAGKVDVQFIDVWENRDAGKKYGINIIPTQIFYDAAGKELFRHEGFFGKEDILAKWKEFGVDLAAN